MKEKIKSIIKSVKISLSNLFIKLFYRWQLKYKLRGNNISNKEYEYKIFDYWGGFNVNIRTYWHQWYASKNGIFDVKYIPEDIFYTKIEPFYNRIEMKSAYTDKALNSVWFPDVKKPFTIVKNMSGIFYDDDFNVLSLENVLERCEKYNRVIIKPTIDSGGGKGIEFFATKKSYEMREIIKKKMDEISKDFIIQEIIEQHESLKCLNPSSVNTIRITTFLYNNCVHVLRSHIRIGIDNSMYDHYGIVCGIEDDGFLKNLAFTYKKYDIVKEHPQGYEFKGINIPSFNKIKEIVRREHQKFGHFRLISWDFSVDKLGEPILIEINLRWQGLNHHQLTMGPLFGDLTNEVLAEVFGRKLKD